MAFYSSPRWSGEILDCSMPMTFDQYNRCSYDCLYCFSFFQRALAKYNPNQNKNDSRLYTEKEPLAVSPENVLRIFDGGRKSDFNEYTKARLI